MQDKKSAIERISTIHNIERLLKEKTFFKKSGAGEVV